MPWIAVKEFERQQRVDSRFAHGRKRTVELYKRRNRLHAKRIQEAADSYKDIFPDIEGQP
jgi:hypothetical protein